MSERFLDAGDNLVGDGTNVIRRGKPLRNLILCIAENLVADLIGDRTRLIRAMEPFLELLK